MTVVTAAPEEAAVAETPAAVVEAAGQDAEPGRAELIVEMEAERAAVKTWLTLVYQVAVDYQDRSYRQGRRVCVVGFNRWLRKAGFPTGRTDDVLPDRDATIAVPGDDDVPLEHLTVLGLRARQAAWQAAYAEKRTLVRKTIIEGVQDAHGNFPASVRDEMLRFLGLEPTRRKTQVYVGLSINYLLDQVKTSDAAIKERVAEALRQAIGDGELTSDLVNSITVEHAIVEAA